MTAGFRLLALVLVLLSGQAAGALANPFTGDRAAPAAEQSAEPERARGPVAAVGRALLTFQRESNRLIGAHMRAIRDGESAMPLLVGALLAFAYGVVHALGPGHGKLVVVSYFLSREARIGRGLLMGLQIAAFHVISAMVVVALADFVLRQAFGGAPAEAPGVRLASYGLIALSAAPCSSSRSAAGTWKAPATRSITAVAATRTAAMARAKAFCHSA